MIILKDGNSLYFGKANESIKFFEERGKLIQSYFNPFEFILDTIQNYDIKANKGKLICYILNYVLLRFFKFKFILIN